MRLNFIAAAIYLAITSMAGMAQAAPVSLTAPYNTTNPTYGNGVTGELQITTRGSLQTAMCDPAAASVTSCAPVAAPADALTNTNVGVLGRSMGLVFNGTTWDRTRSIQDTAILGVGVLAVAQSPYSAVGGAIVPQASAAAASSLVLKASAGNLYRLSATSTVAGFLMAFNAASAPADGAVTPLLCVGMPVVNTTVEYEYRIPLRFATGITLVFSTTGCFSKTASATAFLSGDAV